VALLGCLLLALNVLKTNWELHVDWDLLGPFYELMIVVTFMKCLAIAEYAVLLDLMIMENMLALLLNSHAFIDFSFQFYMFWWPSLERLVLFTLVKAKMIWSLTINLFYLINVKYFHVSSFVLGLLFISKSFLECWFSCWNIFNGSLDSFSYWLETWLDLYLTVMGWVGCSPVLETLICLKSS